MINNTVEEKKKNKRKTRRENKEKGTYEIVLYLHKYLPPRSSVG